jgi:hypothetical protein
MIDLDRAVVEDQQGRDGLDPLHTNKMIAYGIIFCPGHPIPLAAVEGQRGPGPPGNVGGSLESRQTIDFKKYTVGVGDE